MRKKKTPPKAWKEDETRTRRDGRRSLGFNERRGFPVFVGLARHDEPDLPRRVRGNRGEPVLHRPVLEDILAHLQHVFNELRV
jgi:hypothetical protein